tara:strand:+ start:1991 stop:2413 length:423 start_codon:yes stop_codon:yes gene_type:complete
MRTLDLNLDENRGELDFNFDNVIGGSLSTPYVPSTYKIGGSLTTPYLPSKYKIGLGSNINTPKISLGLSEETKAIMDRIKAMSGNIPKFDPTSSTKTTTPTTTTIVDKGDTKTKKSKMPIALIGGGVLVVGIVIYFIVKN